MPVTVWPRKRGTDMEDLNNFIESRVHCNALVYGNPGTGKTFLVKKALSENKRHYVMVDSFTVVDIKILLNKLYFEISGNIRKLEGIQDFIDELESYDGPEMVLVLKNLQSVSISNSTLDLFRLFNNLRLDKIQVIFIVSTPTVPNGLITCKIPKFYFCTPTQEQLIAILSSDRNLDTERNHQSMVKNFVQVMVSTYYPYTTDVRTFKNMVTTNWPKFTAPLQTNPKLTFMDLYSRFKQNLSEELVAKRVVAPAYKESQSLEKVPKTSALTAILVVLSYLASYNDPRYDFTIFSKLKEIRSGKRTFSRRKRNGSVKKIINTLRWFEFERAISILKSISKDSEYYQTRDLKIDLGTYVEFNNLVTLKLLIRNENRYKINCNFTFVKACCERIGLDIENYLAE